MSVSVTNASAATTQTNYFPAGRPAWQDENKLMLAAGDPPINTSVHFVACQAWMFFFSPLYPPTLTCGPAAPFRRPREVVSSYARANQGLFRELMSAVLEAMGITGDGVLEELDGGTQMMMVNCFPACPEPDLTLGMPPHSDYGFLTLVLQDDVEGLQVMHGGEWLTVDPVPGSFVVNVGDHFEVHTHLPS